ncbi:MAG: Ni/Fe-hydrogenase cytochrome b subunit [Acidobacteria bacterium]|nr:Ni/Fe-hydrogenase cytochrome b subunit [Acidobacteriota bacterium]
MAKLNIPKLTFWRGVLFIILASGLYSTFVRFSGGLGASTALSDRFPWGLWIGFDVLCGVALAAGGFTISAVVYIFHIERFKPIIRPTILTAFLGYSLVVVALMFDLGKPYNIWHPIIMWNPHSVMFEVAWCVMLYTTVLALEFSPMLFERLRMEKAVKTIHALTIPLVILGVILSMLHQSSLGSLFLIVPHKLHPLWYSPLLPVFFFISAVALGCAMTILESFLSFRVFRKRLELDLLADLGKVIVVVLAVYLVLKIQDLTGKGALGLAFESSYAGRMFLAEMLLGIITPIIMLAIPRIRTNDFGLFVSALMVVLGFIMNRLNVSITGIEAYSGVSYFPSWTEVSVTIMIVALGFVLFGLAVKYLPVFPAGELVKSSEEGAPELPAPAVLRRPLLGSTALVLILGGVLMGSAVGLAYSGIRHRGATVAVEVVDNREPDISAGLQSFQAPPDVTFPQAQESPGAVTFSHASHIDWNQPKCATCHNQSFNILKVRQTSSLLAAKLDMHSVERCGACHDGQKAFNVKQDCMLCHKGE